MAIKDFPVDMSSATIDPDNDWLLFSDTSDSNNAKKTTLTSAINTKIDDGSTSTSKLRSSNKINTELALKQDILTGLTASVAELNILDGATLATTELNYVDGVTSNIQTQLDGKQPLDADLTTIAGLTATSDSFMQAKAGARAARTIAEVKTDLGLTGTNSGDQTSIVGITGTKSQFDTAVTDGNFLYVGDITQYTDELAQDAVGAMIDSSLNYVDGTPLLQRAALTGDVTASAGSNSTAIDKTAITGKTVVTAVGTDYVLISDTSDSGNLKKALISDIGGGGGTPGGSDTQVQFNDGGSFGGDANFTYDKTNDVLHVHKIAGDATDGLIIESANGTDVGILGAANTANVNWYGSHNFSTATQDTIAGFTGSGKTLGSLSTATYPSLTELSYVKGVTSAIQTQINALANGMIYKGNWDASTGTFPGASVAQTGWFYTVSVAGTVDSVVFNVGDRLIAITNNASTTTYAGNWTQLDATDAVTSVFGRTGNVVATAGDYTAAQITNTPAGSIAAVNVQAAIDELATEKANASGALTQFVGNTAWRVFYSDGSGDITELALGASGTYLKSNGASSAPSFATPTGTGDVSKVGTPVNNQLGVWTGDGTLEGTADVTYDSSTKAMTFNQILDGATFAVYTANTAENSYSYLEFSDTEAAIDTPAFSLITGASLFSLNQGGTDAIFNVSGLASTNKTFTFPNATGTVSLIANTETLTNKRVTKRITTITSSATPTINTDNCDCVTITALAEAITSMTTNLSGTPSNFDSLVIRIKDNGTARAITWGASFEAKGVALPTTTVLSKVLTVGFIYDTVTSKWGCVASAQEA